MLEERLGVLGFGAVNKQPGALATIGCEPLRDAAFVAGVLGIPEKTVLQYAREARLPCVRLGRHVRFVMADVERAVDGMRSG